MINEERPTLAVAVAGDAAFAVAFARPIDDGDGDSWRCAGGGWMDSDADVCILLAVVFVAVPTFGSVVDAVEVHADGGVENATMFVVAAALAFGSAEPMRLAAVLMAA